jgi:hypothetical protein
MDGSGVVACNNCSHKAPMPVDRLIRKHRELVIVEVVLVGLKCSNRGGYGANGLMLKLCEPGCPKQR